MGGETERSVSGWTVDTLKEHLEKQHRDGVAAIEKNADERNERYEQRFKAMDEKTSLALTASEKAVAKAELAVEKRFDSVNEFRGTLSDQAATMMPRAEAQARLGAQDKDIEALKQDVTKLIAGGSGGRTQRDDLRANLGTFFAAAALAVVLWRVVTGH